MSQSKIIKVRETLHLNPGRKRFVLLTTSLSGCYLARGLIDSGHLLVRIGVGRVSSGSGPIGSIETHDALSILGEVPTHSVCLDFEDELVALLSSETYDFVVLSWPKIVSNKGIKASSNRIIGTHPTPLPLGRGRHPLHWMQVLGIRTSRLTAFWLEDGVDSGPILASVRFHLNRFGPIKDNNRRADQGMWKLGVLLGAKFLLRMPPGKTQEGQVSTIFRKRTEQDSALDFRMTARAIVSHVQSFSLPWPLASATLHGRSFRVADAKFAPFALCDKRRRWSTFGTVLRTEKGDWVLVRCYQGAVWLKLENEFDSLSELSHSPPGTSA